MCDSRISPVILRQDANPTLLPFGKSAFDDSFPVVLRQDANFTLLQPSPVAIGVHV